MTVPGPAGGANAAGANAAGANAAGANAAGAAGAPGGAGPPALDDMMLAMDVVDTLRHRQVLVERELGSEARDEALLERLRQLYAAQGIEVPDHVLTEGVSALREDRFAYRPPPPGLGTLLARAYVRRGRIGGVALALAVVLALVWGVHNATVVAPRQALVGALDATHARVLALATVPEAGQRAETALRAGQAALGRDDVAAARGALTDLEVLEATLEQRYRLLIVAGPDSVSGVWRVPDVNVAARNHYLIVEALDEAGRRVQVDVRNEETGAVERVSTWGLRVPQEVFERVAADKLADGIIQDRFVGEKVRGALTPDYAIETTGGAITRW